MDSEIKVNPLLKGMMNYHNAEAIKQVSAKTFTKFLVAKSESEKILGDADLPQSLHDSFDTGKIPVS